MTNQLQSINNNKPPSTYTKELYLLSLWEAKEIYTKAIYILANEYIDNWNNYNSLNGSIYIVL